MEQKLYDAASKLPETGLDFHTIQPTRKSKSSSRTWRAIVSAAACFILLISIGFITVEAKEYSDAIAFFNTHGLPTDGLTRSQIKAVYRDITTASFSHQKTHEVILSSDLVAGFEIQQEVLTSKDLEEIWNSQFNGIHYEVLTVNPDQYFLQKFDGEQLVWSAECSEFLYPYYKVVHDGVFVYGRNIDDCQPLLLKLDNSGNLLWRSHPDNGFRRESFVAILENDDGSYALISSASTESGNQPRLCLSQYAPDGTRMLYKSSPTSGYAQDAARLGDGYLVHLNNDEIVKIDREGNLTDSFSYTAEESVYRFQDMIEFQGEIYLSAYATPRQDDNEQSYGGRSEISRILDYVSSKKNWDFSDDELTAVVRDNYTAVLFLCDPDSGIPRSYYSVPGSLGGKLSLSDDGMLLWDVESITTTFFSPATSSFTIGGTSCVFRYTFDASGTLISQDQTGETVNFRR